jgi:hypothetical protein
MGIDKKSLREFKAIWKEEFDEEINNAKAQMQATKLLTLVKTIAEYLEFKELSKNKRMK